MSSAEIVARSPLLGGFTGYRPQSLYRLEDGSCWLQTDSLLTDATAEAPEVIVQRDADGFSLRMQGQPRAIQVWPVSQLIESRIRGVFSGWNGSSEYELLNGQVWRQAKFRTQYARKYMPEVLLYQGPTGFIMRVAGSSIPVRRVR